jgi:hypothetical protein
MSKRLLRWPWNLVVVLVIGAATLYFDLHAMTFTNSDGMVLWMPRHSGASGIAAVDAYRGGCSSVSIVGLVRQCGSSLACLVARSLIVPLLLML